MIIADILPARATPERYRNLVAAAVAAHMNMIRVWGGGLYPPQDFYDICDERGVLVWQEAMMACALYPRDAGFLQEVISYMCIVAMHIPSTKRVTACTKSAQSAYMFHSCSWCMHMVGVCFQSHMTIIGLLAMYMYAALS